MLETIGNIDNWVPLQNNDMEKKYFLIVKLHADEHITLLGQVSSSITKNFRN